MKFRQLMIDATGLDPFTCVTIASVCMTIYRSTLMPVEYEVEIDNVWMKAWLREDRFIIAFEDHWEVVPQERINNRRYVKSLIAQVPAQGYNEDNYSHKSIQWLEWVMEQSRRDGQPIHIQHALNGGEVKIPGTKYKADGFCRETNTVYEFHG